MESAMGRLISVLFISLFGLVGPAWSAEPEPLSPTPAVAEPSAATAEDIFQFFEQEAKVVTASRRAQTVREAPANIRVITREQIRAQGARTLADVLLFIPGVQIIKHKTGGEQIWIRGTTSAYNDKTLLLIDGHPFKELVYGQHPINEQVSLVDVDHIELIKGPGSSLYGSNAFTGVINIITVDPRAADAHSGFKVEGGDYNTYGGSAVAVTRKDSLAIVASGSFLTTDGDQHERAEDGALTSRRDNHRLLNANARVAIGEVTAGMRLIDYTRGYLNRIDTRTENLPTRTALLSLDWDHEFGELLTLSVSSYYNNFDWRREQFRTSTTLAYHLDRLQFSDEKTSSHAVSMQAEWRLPARNLLLTAVDYEVENVFSMQRIQYQPKSLSYSAVVTAPPVANRITDPPNPFAQRWSVAAEDTWSAFDWLRFTAGYRYDNDLRFEGQHNVRGAVVVNPVEQVALKLLYGTAYRAPSFREMVLRDVPFDLTANDGGNGNIKPERIETGEALVDWAIVEGLSTQVAGYHNIITGVIAPDARTHMYNNVGSYTTYGVEPSLTYNWGKAVNSYVNYTRQQSIDENGNVVGNVAEELWNAGLGVRLPWYLALRADWHRTGRRNKPAAYQSGLGAAYSYLKLNDYLAEYDRTDIAVGTHSLPVNVQVILKNACDATYYDPDFGDGKMDMQWAGRSIFVQMDMEL
jgi:iron complex outermembrane receptor protein